MMDSIYLQRRYPAAYQRGVKDFLRGYDGGDFNPYQKPSDENKPSEYGAYNAGWNETAGNFKEEA